MTATGPWAKEHRGASGWRRSVEELEDRRLHNIKNTIKPHVATAAIVGEDTTPLKTWLMMMAMLHVASLAASQRCHTADQNSFLSATSVVIIIFHSSLCIVLFEPFRLALERFPSKLLSRRSVDDARTNHFAKQIQAPAANAGRFATVMANIVTVNGQLNREAVGHRHAAKDKTRSLTTANGSNTRAEARFTLRRMRRHDIADTISHGVPDSTGLGMRCPNQRVLDYRASPSNSARLIATARAVVTPPGSPDEVETTPKSLVKLPVHRAQCTARNEGGGPHSPSSHRRTSSSCFVLVPPFFAMLFPS